MGPRGIAIASARGRHRLLSIAVLVVVMLATAGVGGSTAVRAAAPALKAVIIVGPTHALTDSNLAEAEGLAQAAQDYGMDVRRVFFPNATWDNVLANVDGANLVVYLGHGYGWPSPYPPFRERLQNGIGLDPYAGAANTNVEYHGAKWIRENWHLAPNAIVFLNHLCYAAGNGESGMTLPSWDTARQRVDNFASGFLYAGARAVFAYSWQSYLSTLNLLMTTNETVDDIFRTPGAQPHPYYGWIGRDPRYFDSVRTPGARNLLDPHSTLGFMRAVSGDLTMTAGQWRGEQTGSWSAPAFQNVPPTPQGLTGQALNYRYVRLTWQPVEVNYFGGATYKVFRNGKSLGNVGKVTTWTDRPAYVGTYTYQVLAVDPARAKSALSASVTVRAVLQATGSVLVEAFAAP